MCDTIIFFFNVCIVCGICVIATVHENSNDKLDRLYNKLDAIYDTIKHMNTMAEEKRKRKEA